MRIAGWRGAAVALVAGFAGAAVAVALGLPAAALLGSTLAVTIVAIAGLRPAIPASMRDIAFSVIGVSLGSGVTPEILTQIARWPLSIIMLGLTVLAVMAASGAVLRFLFGADPRTSVLATSPGALSYTLALAADRGADLRFVMVLQSLRLFLITMLLPPIIGYAEGGGEGVRAAGLAHVGYAETAVLLVATFAIGALVTRLRFPAPYLLAGLVISGIAHGSGLVSGRLADPVTFFGFGVTGMVIGSRFSGTTLAELKRLGGAGLLSTAVAVAISMLSAFGVSRLLGIPFGQVWVSYAPGGVEGMSSIALALGYDPVYVAAHHVFRILLLIAILPVLLALFSRNT